MQKIRYKVLLDVTRSGCQQTVDGIYRTENNIREFEIILLNGAQTLSLDSDASVVIYGRKSDGTYFMQSCSISDGNVLFCPKSDILSVCGDVECQVQVMNGDGAVMFSPSFIISVSDTVRSEQAIESSDEFTVLDEALLKVSMMNSGVPVYASYNDLPDESSDNSLSFVKSGSDNDFGPVYLAVASFAEDSTKLPYEKLRVSATVPEYDEDTFRTYIEKIVANNLGYELSTYIHNGTSSEHLKAEISPCYSSVGKYPGFDPDNGIIPTVTSECDYAVCINPLYFIYLDSEGNEIASDDFANLHAVIQQYFYFFGDADVYLDLDDTVLDLEVKKGWYAWKMVDPDGSGYFSQVVIEPIDNPNLAVIVTGPNGYGNCSGEEAKKLLDGIFETPQKSGFYLKEGKWKNVVEGKKV